LGFSKVPQKSFLSKKKYVEKSSQKEVLENFSSSDRNHLIRPPQKQVKKYPPTDESAPFKKPLC
jgi:hypothetical protein